MVTGSKRESTTPGATSRSFSRKGLITHRIGSYTSDSIQDVNTQKVFGIQIYMYTRWGQHTSNLDLRFHSHNLMTTIYMPLSYYMHVIAIDQLVHICALEMRLIF